MEKKVRLVIFLFGLLSLAAVADEMEYNPSAVAKTHAAVWTLPSLTCNDVLAFETSQAAFLKSSEDLLTQLVGDLNPTISARPIERLILWRNVAALNPEDRQQLAARLHDFQQSARTISEDTVVYGHVVRGQENIDRYIAEYRERFRQIEVILQETQEKLPELDRSRDRRAAWALGTSMLVGGASGVAAAFTGLYPAIQIAEVIPVLLLTLPAIERLSAHFYGSQDFRDNIGTQFGSFPLTPSALNMLKDHPDIRSGQGGAYWEAPVRILTTAVPPITGLTDDPGSVLGSCLALSPNKKCEESTAYNQALNYSNGGSENIAVDGTLAGFFFHDQDGQLVLINWVRFEGMSGKPKIPKGNREEELQHEFQQPFWLPGLFPSSEPPPTPVPIPVPARNGRS